MIYTKNGLKILYLVIHSKTQSNRFANIIKTWGKNQNIIFYSDHSFKNKIIKVSDDSTRFSGEDKILNLINNNNKSFVNFDWFFFVDNDSFVNTKKLEKEIEKLEENKVYGHMWNCWNKDPDFFYCLGGAGVLMSRGVISKIKNNFKNYNVGWSDVSIGLNLKRLNIEMENHNLFHPNRPQKGPVPSDTDITESIPDEKIKDHITFHYITDYKEMKKLSKLCDLDQIKNKIYNKRNIKC